MPWWEDPELRMKYVFNRWRDVLERLADMPKEDLRHKAGGKYVAPTPFKVYYWDTFDNETIQIGEFPDQPLAEAFVETRYAGRIGPQGADKVDIVLDGTIVRQYSVS